MTFDSQDAWLERRRAAHDAASALPQEVAWVSAVADWWSAIPIEDQSVPPPIQMPQHVIASTPGGEELARSLSAVVSRSIRSPGHDHAAVLLARGVARATSALPPNLSAFQRGALFCGDARDDFGSFEAAFVAECRRDPIKLEAWIHVLTESASDLESYGLGSSPEDSFVRGPDEQEKALGTGDDYRQVWRRYGWSGWHRPAILARFNVLLELDPAAFARAIDRVPSQAMREALMEVIELGKGPELSSELLAVAPSAVDAAGNWNGSVFALMLLNAPARYVQRELLSGHHVYVGAPPDSRSPDEKSKIKGIYKSFFDAAVKRVDATFLSFAFAVEMARRAIHPRTLPRVTWTLEEVALEEVVDALARTGVSIADLKADCDRRIARDETEGAAAPNESGVPHLLVAACLWATQSFSTEPTQAPRPGVDPGAGARAVWSWYKDFLLAGNTELAGHLNPYGQAARWVFVTLGLALAALTDPVVETRETWEALYEQRFRGRMVFGEFDAAGPSLHLLRIARGSLEWLLGGATQGVADSNKAESMWRLLHQIAVQVLGSLSTNHFRQDRDALTSLYAFLPHVFSGRWREALASDGPLLASDDLICIVAAANVAGNGVAAVDVKDCMIAAGCDPLRAGDVLRTYLDRVEPRDQTIINTLKLLEVFRAPSP